MGGGEWDGRALSYLVFLWFKHIVSTDLPSLGLSWAYPEGALNKRISGLSFIKHGHKILIRASWMKSRIIPRAQRNDFNLSWSTSYSFEKTLMRLKHLTPESNKNDWEAGRGSLWGNISSSKDLLITPGRGKTQADCSLIPRTWSTCLRIRTLSFGAQETLNRTRTEKQNKLLKVVLVY